MTNDPLEFSDKNGILQDPLKWLPPGSLDHGDQIFQLDEIVIPDVGQDSRCFHVSLSVMILQNIERIRRRSLTVTVVLLFGDRNQVIVNHSDLTSNLYEDIVGFDQPRYSR